MHQTMNIATIGIDIGKTWFHVVGCNDVGTAVMRQKLNRSKLMPFFATLPKCLIGMEACSGSQHLARAFQGYGHEVRLIAPKFVRPYVKGQKNDFNDAAAIAEAVTRPTMRFVLPKSIEQLDLQAIHRIRDRLVGERTAVINQIRGFLIEYGLPVKEGRPALKRDLADILEDAENGLSGTMRQLISRLRNHWQQLEAQVEECARDIELIVQRNHDCQRLLTVPGIGPLGATALIAAVGNATTFRKGRELAAWLGLVPRQRSTGGQSTLLGIGKRGNTYVRRLFIHGARSVFQHLKRDSHDLGPWMTQLEKRAHKNVVIVAIANKMARIAWAVLSRQENYRSGVVMA
jgi:transposase